MEVSIIIPVHRGGTGIHRLLDSIDTQVNAPENEVILVANPSNPALKEAVAAKSHIRYLETSVIGANNARNLGLKTAVGRILLFVDDDCFMQDQTFLRSHWLAHEMHKDITGIGGPYALAPRPGLIATAYQLLQANWVRESPQPGYKADLLLGGNMSFKREALEREKFDPSIAFGGTETELIFRLAAAGFRIKFLEGLSIQHNPADGIIKFLLKAVKQGCGAAFLRRRNYYGVPLVATSGKNPAFPPSFAVSVLMSLHRSFFRAGFARGKFSGHFSEAQMLLAGAVEAAKEPWRRLYYLFFVEVWGILRSAILLRKLGLVKCAKVEDSLTHRS